jgi:GalNAc-alpha-(1->4)-GalNAc-alpha-(1->3)-diNAcBac-PP-undecaprenol alpha-1,4-N-acetyl-D-galactosaminyltransferase
MERVMSELASYFCEKNELEVHVVLYGKSPEMFYDLPENLVIHKPGTVFDNRLRLYYSILRMIFLRRSVKAIDPHSILSFGEYWNSFVLLALMGLPYPVFISDRCSPAKRYSFFHVILRKWLYPNAKGIIAQTAHAKQHYQTEFENDNIVVIGNPIRLLNYNYNHRENIVLTIGRLIESKNHDKIIELFCRINRPGWKLVIVGGDALKQNNLMKLNELVSSLSANSKVVLTGYRNDLDTFYMESSIFVLASDSEGFPNVIGEAMSAGMPVVSFDCIAGPSEMITEGEDGYLVPVNDYAQFSERLELLMSDEPLRVKMGSKARVSIQKFSAETIGSKYYNLILGNENPSD